MDMRLETQGPGEVEEKLLEVISPEYLESLVKFLRVIRKLDEMGILDTLYDLIEPEVIGDLMNAFITTNTIYLLSNVDDAVGAMVKFMDAFKDASNAVNNDNRPVIRLLYELLTDEDAKRGLRFLNALLKGLGRRLSAGEVRK